MATTADPAVKPNDIYDHSRDVAAGLSELLPHVQHLAPFKSEVHVLYEATQPGGPATVLAQVEDFIIIEDKFPKSALHALLIPLPGAFPGRHAHGRPLCAASLTLADLPALRAATRIATDWVTSQGMTVLPGSPCIAESSGRAGATAQPALGSPGAMSPRRAVRLGFHLRPTLPLLHLHIISQDFTGPHAKTFSLYARFQGRDLFVDAARLLEAGEAAPAHTDAAALLLDLADAVIPSHAVHAGHELADDGSARLPWGTALPSFKAVRRHLAAMLDEPMLAAPLS